MGETSINNKQLEINFEEEVNNLIASEEKPSSLNISDKEWKLLEFKRKINQRPTENLIKTNQNYGNRYIPLQVIEIMLNAIFESVQYIVPFQPSFVEGNIIFTIIVRVKHPVTGDWLDYTGTSAVPIHTANGHIRDIHSNLPAGKSYAIMNAVKHIGQLFRAESDDYTRVLDSYFEDKQEEAKSPEEDRILRMIEAADTLEKLNKLGDKYKQFDSTYEPFRNKFEELTKNN